ncbi:hypothetical protein KKH18_13150, partial [bacterium]|nr:hypothetical protein [bacterium]
MKKFLVVLMSLTLLCGIASADNGQPQHSALAADLLVRIESNQLKLTSELEALEADIAAAKLNGEDPSYLFALIDDVRNELGMNNAKEFGRYPLALDEGGENCDGATIITSLPYSDTGNTCDNVDNDAPTCGGITNYPSPDVYYAFTPAVNMEVRVSTCLPGTDFDTILKIRDSAGNLVACNDDGPGDACDLPNYDYKKSTIGCTQLNANERYCIVVDGYNWNPNGLYANYKCGNYEITVEECEPPPAPPVCPEGSLFAQTPYGPDGNWNAGVSDLRDPPAYDEVVRYESFSGVNEPICGISWWGYSFRYTGSGWVVCDEDPMTFAISFFTDNAGAPGSLVQTDTVTLSRQETGIIYSGLYPLYSWSTSYDSPIALSDGWVSIEGVSVGSPENCWFLWATSPDGDGTSLLFQTPGVPLTIAYFDLSFCLTGCDICEAPEIATVDVSDGIPTCACVDACQGPQTVVFAPLTIDQRPLSVRFDEGCDGEPFRGDPLILPGYSCEETDCPPAYPDPVSDFYYSADLGGWCIDVVVNADGCYCVCIDDILPVELVGFEAIPADGEITLSWTTASEVNNDRFEIMRDATLIGVVDAHNSATGHAYSWTESNLTNGREYSYSLIAVSMDGIRETIGTVSATPSANAAT